MEAKTPRTKPLSAEKSPTKARTTTLYDASLKRLKNNWVVVVCLVAAGIIAGTAQTVQYLHSLYDLIFAPPSFDKAVQNLASSDQGLRVVGALDLEKAGVNNADIADKAVKVLVAFLEKRAKWTGPAELDEPRPDIQAAVKALGVNLKKIHLTSRSITKPELSHLNLVGLDLTGIHLSGVIISNSHLEDAILNSADLSNSTIVNVRFDRIQAHKINVANSTILGSCFEEADLTDSDMNSIKTQSSDFNSAFLNRANLSNATILDTRLANTTLDDVNLDAADLRGALEIVERQLYAAKSKRGIILPSPLFVKSKLKACVPTRTEN